MYTLEHMELVHSIRKGKLMAQPETTAISSMACIMARESAYTGKTITWEDITNEKCEGSKSHFLHTLQIENQYIIYPVKREGSFGEILL
jgi:hypothetical protein